MSDNVAPEFSFPADITTLQPTGRIYAIKTTPEERLRVATRLGLQKIDALTATLEVKATAAGRIEITGEVKAHIVQTCVVSLAAVPAQITESISAAFVTEERAAKDKIKRERAQAKKRATKKSDEDEEAEIVALHGDDPPDVAKEGRIDLGEVAVVHLALALDPYPRAPGAAFDEAVWTDPPENDEKPASVSPFAALAKLKKPGSGQGGA